MDDNYTNIPKVLDHKPIKFETTFSGYDEDFWKEHWEEKIDKIEDWFKDICCFTNACLIAKGLPDNCFELETLRRFRDNELLKTNEGKDLVNKFYKNHPTFSRENK